ncbi:MAG TPA: immunoglobulin domain-containing protein [Verrucomicrobiae bacterium]|nr:immunoglobulin domain-containing protein [Verrucomicrobiae bacterium]
MGAEREQQAHATVIRRWFSSYRPTKFQGFSPSRKFKPIAAIAAVILSIASAQAQLFNFTTFAGSAAQGDVDGVTNLSEFNNPGGVAMDSSGNIYIADTADDTIRKIAANGNVSTFAGSPGNSGSADGSGTNALFNAPQGIAVDSSGNVYVADTGNDTLRKITPGGAVTTLAGLAGNAGSANGSGTNAAFYAPEGLAVDAAGNIFVADTWNDTVREVSPSGSVTTVAGWPGSFGSTNATGTNALFNEPGSVAVDAGDDVFVADTGNNLIREIASSGTVTTFAGSIGNFGSTNGAGTSASFNAPQGIAIDTSGNLYVADYLNNAIRKVTAAGIVTTVAGSPGNFGSGNGTNALFWGPQGVVVCPTNNNLVYVADTGNSSIRQLSASGQTWTVSAFAGNASDGSADAAGAAARLFWPMDIASDGHGNFYVADAQNNTIRKIAANGTVSTFAGFPGVTGSANATGTNASFNDPQAVAVDGSGNVYVADTGNSAIREISSGGVVSTLAGSPGSVGSSDGTGSAAQFDAPQGIAVNGSGDVFVADTMNHTIREIASGGVVTTFAGFPGNFGSADGTSGAAQFDRPTGLAIDGAGNLFVADLLNQTIREITPAGVVSTIAGLARIFGDSDGTNSAATFFEPEGIAVGSGDTLYVADSGNDSIRQLTPSGTNWVVTTIAGWPGVSGSQDGSGIVARFCYPAGMVVSGGNLFVADSANNTIRSGSMVTDQPPVISSQPQSQAVMFGTPVTFSVSAIGQGTLYYQWFFNGAEIPGATGSMYSLAAAQSANAGTYAVLISSGLGNILSSNAVLTVYAPPAIINQPVSQTCLQGSTVSFSVTAGPAPVTYQWEENGHPLSNSANVGGANTATLTLTNVTTASSATYSVVVSGAYGSVSSSPATLMVFYVPPTDSIQPVAWWLLNEGTGTVAYDYSGNGHNGTINPGVSWTSAGYSGTGAYFDGTTGGDIAIGSAFSESVNWTATMWVNRWGTKNSSVLVGGQSYALKLEQSGDSGHVGYTWYSHNDYELNYVTPVNSWVHLAFVETSAGVSLYTNGVFAASLANTASLNATTIGFGLTAATTDYLDATLDDVRLYNQALTQQQVSNIYAYGRISPIPSVTLTSPANGESYSVAANITLTATVVTNAQSISAVQFYQGSTLLGQSTTAPFAFTWSNAPAGSYSLTADVLYNGGSVVASPAVGIFVGIATNAPSLSFSTTNGTLGLSWPSDHTGWELETQTNPPGKGLSSNWTMLSSSVSTNVMNVPVNPASGSVFYRLVY